MADVGSLDLGDLSFREEDLVRAAYRAVTTRGGHRVSLADIAAEAGVSRALLSYHFDSKDQLLFLTMQWALAAMGRRIRRRTATIVDPVERLATLTDVLFAGPEQNRRFMLLYLDLVEHARRVDRFADLFTLIRSMINGSYEELLRDGVAAGAFDIDDVVTAAISMRGLIEGLLVTWLQEDDLEASHATYRALCEQGLYRLLGVDRPR